MKRTLFFLALIFCAAAPVLCQSQSGYGGDGKAASGATVSSFIKLYETAPGAATTALAGAGAGNVDNGAHLVKVTCYTPGGETTGGTASNSTTVADKTTNGKIALTGIPTCSTIATGRRVYMTAAGGSSYWLLSNGTIANNTATTLTANDSDATLTASTAIPISNTALDTRLTIGQDVITISTAALAWSSKAQMRSPSDGIITLYNNAASDFTRLQFGGTTNSFPSLARSGTIIYAKLADDSAYASLGAVAYYLSNGSDGQWKQLVFEVRSDSSIGWSGSTNASAALDTSLSRVAAGVVGANLSAAGTDGWFQNRGGEGSLTAAFTNATTTMAATNLSYTVIAGRSYRIHGVLAIANSTAGHGIKLDFDGGAATATTFWATATVLSGGTAAAGTLTSTSLAGDINFTSVTGTVYVAIDGYLLVNGAGTFILRAAEDSTGGASASIAAGSWIALSDTVLK